MLCLTIGFALLFLSGASFERKCWLKSPIQAMAAAYFIVAGIGSIN